MTTAPLDGKVVLLTGASGGIGSVTARALGAAGADLIGHYRSDRAGAEAAVAEIPRERCLLLQGDPAAWTLLALASFVAVQYGRTVLEERLLRSALPSYDDYAKRTPRRLVPFLY